MYATTRPVRSSLGVGGDALHCLPLAKPGLLHRAATTSATKGTGDIKAHFVRFARSTGPLSAPPKTSVRDPERTLRRNTGSPSPIRSQNGIISFMLVAPPNGLSGGTSGGLPGGTPGSPMFDRPINPGGPSSILPSKLKALFLIFAVSGRY